MELLDIQHGGSVEIYPLIKQTDDALLIRNITIELSSFLNYPFPPVLLSQLGMCISFYTSL